MGLDGLSSDTPVFFCGGPYNKHVEDWGLVPRGRLITVRHDGANHLYGFFFFKGPATKGVDDGVIEAVIARYEGVDPS